MLCRLFAILLLLALPAAAAPARSPEELTRRLEELMVRHGVPGMALAIVKADGPVRVTVLGRADVATGRPATEDTLFRVGSTSKLLVSLAVLKLVEEGRLDLQARVADLLPDLSFENPWEATEPLRLVHLLEHSAGWDDIPLKLFAHSDPRPLSLREGLELAPECRRSRWRPGTRSSYCNLGPAVAALVVEKVTGRPFEAYVEEALFRPLGMGASFLRDARPRATLYARGGTRPLPYHHIALRPAGGLNASARDLAALLGFLLKRGEGPGGRLLQATSLERMERPESGWGARAGLRLGYGLGNYTSYLYGHLWHGHGGHVEGGHTELRYLPELGLGYAFSVNAEGQAAFEALDREILGFLAPERTGEVLAPGQVAPPGLAGWYVDDAPRQSLLGRVRRPASLLRVGVQGDRLAFRPLAGQPRTYVHVGAGRFRAATRGEVLGASLHLPEGDFLQVGSSTYRRIGAPEAWAWLGGSVLCLLALASVPCFALVWGLRWALGRLKGVPALHVRVLPLAALGVAALGGGLFGVSLETFFVRFGLRTAWSVGFWACSWAFAALSLASLVAVARAPRRRMNPWAYAHAWAVALALGAVTLFLAWGGWIGLRTWA